MFYFYFLFVFVVIATIFRMNKDYQEYILHTYYF